jgi:hypothetical protein
MTCWLSDVMRFSARRLRLASTGTALIGVSSLVFVVAPRANADSSLASFTAVASAYGAEVTATNPSIPLLPAVQAAGPVAQASLDSLDNSQAFASFPYPGEGLAGAGAFFSGIFGLPLPSYPLYVSTSTAPSRQEGGAPGITLHADSQRNQAESVATVGSGVPGAVSRAQVVDSTGSGGGLAARATATFTGLGVGGVFTVSGGQSTATAEYSGAGITVKSDLRVTDLAVPGLHIQLPAATPGNVPIPVPIPGAPQLPPAALPGLPIPAPFAGATIETPHLGFENGYFTVAMPFLGSQKFVVPASSVLPALAAAGITMTYQAPTPIVQNGKTVGVVAPGVVLSTAAPAPPQNPGYNGPTHLTVTIGRSVASLKDIPDTAAGQAGPNSGDTPAVIGGGTGDGAPGVDAVGSPTTTGGAGVGVVPDLGTPGSPGLAGESGLPGLGLYATPAAARAALDRDLMSIYLALVAVAAIGTGYAVAVRLLGVRLRWTS